MPLDCYIYETINILDSTIKLMQISNKPIVNEDLNIRTISDLKVFLL